ncbi:Listeria/Bacterioides repeat-containing protein, partial [Eubacterium pyruvativorans]|uniref:InlB B-repeat-containing protein n=1 Tax=Eubacterium pyruvativorans TaxID=155865 RepID=UPI0008EE45F4
MRSERHRTKKRCRSPIVRRVSVLLLTAMVLMLYTFSGFSAFAENPQAEQQTEQMMEASSGQETAQTDVSNQIQQASEGSGEEKAASEEQETSSAAAEKKDAVSGETASDEVESEKEKAGEVKSDEEKSDGEKSGEKEKEEALEKEEMPAQQFSGSASNGVSVRASVSEGVFPEGTRMTVSAVSDSVARNAAEKAASEDTVVSDAVGVDISFANRAGEEIEPADGQRVSVTLSLDAQLRGETFRVLHQSDSGDVSVVSGSAQAEGAAFSAQSFSIYVISGEGSDKNPAIGTYQFHDSDGNILDTQKVKNGETLYAPKTPEKSGYIFRGWAKDASGNTVDFKAEKSWTASVSSTETVDLYPVFEEKHYVFFYDSNGEDGRVFLTREGVKGDSIGTSDVILPISSDEAVTGWYTDKDLTRKVDRVELSGENVKLYPKIEKGHYITFETGAGASYIQPQFVSASGKTGAPAEPTRPGYTFAGWYAAETGGTEFEFGNGLPADLTLHARWKPEKNVKYLVIHWQQNANDDGYSYKESEDLSGTAGDTTAAAAKEYPGFRLKETIRQETIRGDGATIVNVYYDREEYSVKFFKSERVLTWRGFEYKWNELYEITARYGANISRQWPENISIWGTKKGKFGEGESPYQSGISTMPLNGAEFYYVSQNGKRTYNLNYWLEGLDGKYTLDHTDSFKSDGRRWETTKEDHYDINGFTYTNNVEDGSRFEEVGEWHTYTYEVNFKYKRNSYDIHFINNGGENKSRAFKYGADISQAGFEPKRPTSVPEEYVFEGWYDNEDYAGDAFDFREKTMPADNITLYAKWTAPSYRVSVHDVDGNVKKTIDVDYDKTITRDQVGDVELPDGSKWIGWAVKNGENYTVFNFNTKIHGDLDLYPYYLSTARYTVTYNVNGGEGLVTDPKSYSKEAHADIQEGAAITPPQGKVFLNWNTKADGTGTTYYPGDRVTVGENLILYAQYGETSKTTTLVYKANYPAGSSDTTPPDRLQIVNGKTDLSNNTEFSLQSGSIFEAPEGYYFTGWKDGSGNSFHAGDSVVVDNTTENVLYAQWEKKKELEIRVTGRSAAVIYDGTERSVSGYDVTYRLSDQLSDQWRIGLPAGLVMNCSETAKAAGTDAGTYPMGLSERAFGITGEMADQYTIRIQVTDGSLTINPKALTLTGESGTITYDGNPHTLDGIKADGLISGHELKGITYAATGTDAGTYEGKFTGEAKVMAGEADVTKNYDITKEPGKLTISKKEEATVTIRGSKEEKTYTGEKQSVEGFQVDGPQDISVKLKS